MPLRMQIPKILLQIDVHELLELEMQGHLINMNASDYLLSQDVF